MREIILFTILLLAGCAGTVNTTTPSHSESHLITQELMTVFDRYEGTPYRYGGTDGNGFDCSGFIHVAYQEAFGARIPRTTEQLATSGVFVRQDQLQPGDIVFFKTEEKQLHAGIYTASNKFIHSSSSHGVIESSLNNVYWRRHYLKARRLL